MSGVDLRAKYPDKVPVILTRCVTSILPEINNKKFLIPDDFTIGEFLCILRKKIKLNSESGIFLFILNTGCLPSTHDRFIELFERYRGDENVLRLEYTGENTFG